MGFNLGRFMRLMGSITALDMKSVANTTIFTNAANQVWKVDLIEFIPNTFTALTVAPTVGADVSGVDNIYAPAAFTGITSAKGWNMIPANLQPTVGASNIVRINVTVGATATTCTMNVYCWGHRIL